MSVHMWLLCLCRQWAIKWSRQQVQQSPRLPGTAPAECCPLHFPPTEHWWVTDQLYCLHCHPPPVTAWLQSLNDCISQSLWNFLAQTYIFCRFFAEFLTIHILKQHPMPKKTMKFVTARSYVTFLTIFWVKMHLPRFFSVVHFEVIGGSVPLVRMFAPQPKVWIVFCDKAWVCVLFSTSPLPLLIKIGTSSARCWHAINTWYIPSSTLISSLCDWPRLCHYLPTTLFFNLHSLSHSTHNFLQFFLSGTALHPLPL